MNSKLHKLPKSHILFHKKRPPHDFLRRTLAQTLPLSLYLSNCNPLTTVYYFFDMRPYFMVVQKSDFIFKEEKK